MANDAIDDFTSTTYEATRPASGLSVYSRYPNRDSFEEFNFVNQNAKGSRWQVGAIRSHGTASTDRETNAVRVPKRAVDVQLMPDWFIPRPKPTIAIPSASTKEFPSRTLTQRPAEGKSFQPVKSTDPTLPNHDIVYTDSMAVRNAAFRMWMAKKKEEQLRKEQSASGRNSYTSQTKGDKPGPQTHELFQTSEQVRKAAYEDWLAKKLIVKRQRLMQEQAEEKEKTAAKEREAHEAAISAQQSFAVWKEKKDKALREQFACKHSEEKKKAAERIEEEEEKKLSSETAFAAWKSSKDEKRSTQLAKKLAERKEKVRKKTDETLSKQQAAESAFKSWKSKKDDLLKEKLREKHELEQTGHQLAQEKKVQRQEEGQRAVQLWIKRKEESETEKQVRSIPSPIEARMVWSPPGKIRHPSSPTSPPPVRCPSPAVRKSSLSYHDPQFAVKGSSGNVSFDQSMLIAAEVKAPRSTQTADVDGLLLTQSS